MQKTARRFALFFLILPLAAMPGWRLDAAEPPPKSPPPSARPSGEPPKQKVLVSKETTFVLGPLGADGSVDFAAALNGLLSKGVTPANNGAVAIWQAIGPEGIPGPDRPRFFKRLGIDPLPATGAYFVTFARFAKQREGTAPPLPADGQAAPASETAFAQESQGAERPWSTTEFPLLADWLAAVDKPLNRVVEGANRPRFFSPVATANRAGTLLGDPQLPLAQTYRVLAHALSIRAMFRVDAGRVDDAVEDALACHRLGRLVAQGPFLFDWLAGATIDDRASILDTRIAEYGQISAERAKSYQSELERLPPLMIGNVVGGGERLLCLDFICKAADDLPASIRLAARASTRNSNPAAATADGNDIDVNAVLRLTNHWYDRAVEALNKPRYSERREGMAKFTSDIESLVRSRDEPHDKQQGPPRGAAGSDAIAGISSQAGEFLTCIHLPAASLYVDIDGRRLARLEIAKGALALAAYRNDHDGNYPDKLADLVPRYAAAAPVDPFAEGRELRYKPNYRGCLLYGVGPNGRDDRGHDTADDPAGDDIALRVPHKTDTRP